MKAFIHLICFSFLLYYDTASLVMAECSPSQIGNPCQMGQADIAPNLGFANPVNLVTGNKYQQEDDLLMRASGIEFIRYYNSLDTQSTQFIGAAWRHSYTRRLYVKTSKTEEATLHAQIIQDDGSRVDFFPILLNSSSKEAQALQAQHGSLKQINPQLWEWRSPQGVVNHFNQQGLLISSKIPGYEATTLEYDQETSTSKAYLTKVSGGHDESLIFFYEMHQKQRRLSRVVSPIGVYQFFYDSPANDSSKYPQNNYRLIKLERPDQWFIHYHYEEQLADKNPFLLTGISYQPPYFQSPIRTNSWQYKQDKVSSSRIHRPLPHKDLFFSFNYLKEATPNQEGLTEIIENENNKTYYHTILLNNRYLLKEISGTGCSFCHPVGTSFTYDKKGRLAHFQGMFLRYFDTGQIEFLSPNLPFWEGLYIRYSPQGNPIAWFSQSTGHNYKSYTPKQQLSRENLANGTYRSYEYSHQYSHIQKFNYGKIGQAPTHSLSFNAIAPNQIELTDQTNKHQAVYIKLGNTLRFTTKYDNQLPIIDQLTPNKEQRLVKYRLPEGGYLKYFYNEHQQIIKIEWAARGSRHPHTIYQKQDDQTWLYGNKLQVKINKQGFQQKITLLDAASKNSIWHHKQWLSPITSQVVQEHSYAPSFHLNQFNQYHYHSQNPHQLTHYFTHSNNQKTHGIHAFDWFKDGRSQGIWEKEQMVSTQNQYDASGYPIQFDNFKLKYNNRNLLHQVYDHNDKWIASYEYNALGQRKNKTTATENIDFYYLDQQLVAEKNHNSKSNSRLTRRYIYAGFRPIAMIDYEHDYKGQIYYIHTDFLGQAFMLTDAQQNVQWLAENEAFGQSHLLVKNISFNLRLPGQYFDQETGFHQNIHRYYSPKYAHYLEPDPLGPLAINDPYGYVLQSPKQGVDPLGLLLFVFDGTTNKPSVESNPYKFTQMYQGQVHYIEGTGTQEVKKYVDYYISEEDQFRYFPDPKKSLTELNKTLEWSLEPYISSLHDITTGSSSSYLLNYQWERLLADIKALANTSLDNTLSIDLIGYSRGAFLASVFAKRLADYTENGLFTYNPDWHQGPPITACLDLRFLGLFDTVAQVGAAGHWHNEYDFTIDPAWSSVAHAFALYEHRRLFPLTSYFLEDAINLTEQFFLGNHGDVGGTINELDKTSKMTPLAGVDGDLWKVSFMWMYDQAKNAGVPLKQLETTQRWLFKEVNNPILHGNDPSYLKKENFSSANDRALEFTDRSGLDIQNDHAEYGLSARQRYHQFIMQELQEVMIPEFNNPPFKNSNDLKLVTAKYQAPLAMIDIHGYLKQLELERGWQHSFTDLNVPLK